MYSSYARSSQKRKNSVKLSVSFYAFGIYWRKSCSQNVDEIETQCYLRRVYNTSKKFTCFVDFQIQTFSFVSVFLTTTTTTTTTTSTATTTLTTFFANGSFRICQTRTLVRRCGQFSTRGSFTQNNYLNVSTLTKFNVDVVLKFAIKPKLKFIKWQNMFRFCNLHITSNVNNFYVALQQSNLKFWIRVSLLGFRCQCFNLFHSSNTIKYILRPHQ